MTPSVRSPRWTHVSQQTVSLCRSITDLEVGVTRAKRRRTHPSRGETLGVFVPFAANVRFAAESDEPVWGETTEMAVSVARSALPSWGAPGASDVCVGGG